MKPNARSSQALNTHWKPLAASQTLSRGQEVEGVGSDKLRVFGLNCTVALIFLRFSFLSELITYLSGRETYVLYIFGPPALIAFLSTGGFRRTFREKGPKYWLWFLVWMWIGLPFSLWKGGSFGLASAYLRTVFIFLLFTVGLTIKWTECRRIIQAIAAAAALNVIVALFFMRSGEERFTFSWSGAIGNSNDFAAHLLLILPFVLFTMLKPGTRWIYRIPLMSIFVVGVFEILRCASRGALIAMVVTIAFLMLRGSMKQRIAIGATGVVLVVLLVGFIPQSTLNRMLSFSKEAGSSQEALESSDIREQLLQDSIKCTFEHPLLGVGLGQFGFYESARTTQAEAGWRQTHNSYTEISSECGLPALAFYLAALIWAFRLLTRIKKQVVGPYSGEIGAAVYVITMGVIAYSVAIFFVNFGYAFEFLVVSALIESMWRAVRDESAKAAPPAAPAPLMSSRV